VPRAQVIVMSLANFLVSCKQIKISRKF